MTGRDKTSADSVVPVNMARLRNGDAVEVGRLFDLHADRLYRYLFYLLRSREDAEDALHDTFLAALKGLPSLRDEHSLCGYLFVSARRLAWRIRAKRGRFVLVEDFADETPSAAAGVESWMIEKERLSELHQALETLTDDQREVIVLAYLESMSYREVGAITGRSENAVKALVFRAMTNLREKLGARRDTA